MDLFTIRSKAFLLNFIRFNGLLVESGLEFNGLKLAVPDQFFNVLCKRVKFTLDPY